MGRIISKRPRLFYGYRIAIATAIITTVHSGCGTFGFSLFIKPLQAEMGWSRGEIMVAFTIYAMLGGLFSPFAGRLVDRYDARRIILCGAVAAGMGFILLSRTESLWQFYLGYGIIGAALAAVGHVPASAVISNWFKKRRGTAIGIMSLGTGLGGIALAPFIGGLIIPNFGWSAAYFYLAVTVWVVIIPLALLVVRTRPADMGLYSDGDKTSVTVIATGDPLPISDGRMTLRMALHTSAFWLIIVSFLASNFSQGGILQTQVPYLEDTGFPVATAATGLGVVGLASAIGKVFFGWLCDRIPPKYASITGFLLQMGGIVILMNIGANSSVSMVWLYAIVYGFGMGNWLPTMSMLTSSTFGVASYGAIFGVVVLAQSTGTATGPLLSGFIYDTHGSYYLAFIIFLVVYAISIPCLTILRRPKATGV